MIRAGARLASCLVIALASGSAMDASSLPPVKDGELVVETAAGPLAERVGRLARGGGRSFWIGYAAPKIAGDHQMCCYDGSRSGSGHSVRTIGRRRGAPGECRVDDGNNFLIDSGDDSAGFAREPFVVLVRIEDGDVDTVRLASSDCTLDLDGSVLRWLPDVDPASSVAWLEGFASRRGSAGESIHGAVMAIALHDDRTATASLESLATGRLPRDTRQEAVFWLGEARGRPGFEVLRRMARQEEDSEVRGRLAFALAESPVEEAIDVMIQLARSDQSPDVRKEAVFWLAQKASRKAVGAISDAIEEDPESEVKQAAVFALSQLPDQEGIPLLIDLVRRNRHPVVREQALFWLGDSGDPRALDFIEEILGR